MAGGTTFQPPRAPPFREISPIKRRGRTASISGQIQEENLIGSWSAASLIWLRTRFVRQLSIPRKAMAQGELQVSLAQVGTLLMPRAYGAHNLTCWATMRSALVFTTI